MDDLIYWQTKLRDAEAELDAATRRCEVDAAARRLMRVKAELRRIGAGTSEAAVQDHGQRRGEAGVITS